MISIRRTPRAGPYVSEQWSLEQAGHNSSGQVSKKMAKKVASHREKVLNNVGQQKSVKVMKYSDVFVKYIQSEHVWTGLETKYMYGGHFCSVSPVVLPYFWTSHILPGIPGLILTTSLTGDVQCISRLDLNEGSNMFSSL